MQSWKACTTSPRLRGLAGEHEVGAAALLEFGLENLEHLDELREDEHLVPGGVERLEQLEERRGLARAEALLAAGERGMAANLAQAGERGEDVHARLAGRRVERGKRLAAALQFREVELALALGELAIDALLDAVGQILRDLLFQAAQHDRPHAAGEQRARGLRGAAIVLLEEFAAVGQVAGMDEFHDAPEIEQAVFQRRAGERELVLGLQRLGRARDHRLGVLDVLRLVENDGAEGEFLQRGEVAAQQRVVGDDEIVRGNFLAQACGDARPR